MADAISVIGPGWRATDSDGNIIEDGILHFFDAGTSDARTVYSDDDLSVALGTTVSCNIGGYPVTSGNNRTLIYTGDTAYKVRLTSATLGGTVWEHDNVRGALDTSSFLTSASVADKSVVAVTANRSVTSDDKGKLLDVDCSGSVLTMTFDDAVTLGDGFWVGIRHNGTANQVEIAGDGSDTFGYGDVNVTRFALIGRGHTVWIVCNAANFKVDAEAPPLIGATTGVIRIADRLSTPPGSPDPGARYIVTSSPTGDWSGFSEHDIAEADGDGGWFNYTPPTDCGWIAYVQDEDLNYQFRASSWVEYAHPASDTVAGVQENADQSEMEAASSSTRTVTPDVLHYHPGVAKAWAYVSESGGDYTLEESYNVSGITDNGTGDVTVTWDTDFSSADYAAIPAPHRSGSATSAMANSQLAGSVDVEIVRVESDSAASIDTSFSVVAFGDQ